MAQGITPDIYDSIYARKAQRTCIDELDAEVIDTCLLDLRSTAFLAPGDLERFVCLLHRYAGSIPVLGDLGCGYGLVGRWLARELDCQLIGIDFSATAIEAARHLLLASDRPQVRFEVADFTQTGLGDGCLRAAVSLDALYLAADPAAALAEAHRILAPEAPLLTTIYSGKSVSNWRQRFIDADFAVAHWHDVSAGWRAGMSRKHRRRWEARDQIVAELGLVGAAEVSVSGQILGLTTGRPYLPTIERFEVVAIRRGPTGGRNGSTD